jgi:hypothetical protein
MSDRRRLENCQIAFTLLKAPPHAVESERPSCVHQIIHLHNLGVQWLDGNSSCLEEKAGSHIKVLHIRTLYHSLHTCTSWGD